MKSIKRFKALLTRVYFLSKSATCLFSEIVLVHPVTDLQSALLSLSDTDAMPNPLSSIIKDFCNVQLL